MSSRKVSPNRSETFGRLLSGAINSIATYEGKTAPIIEEELGSQMLLAGKTIQRYKAGHLPPEPHAVEILAEAAIKRGYLGREWLGRFLHAARYPFADKLLDRLCPIGPARVRPPRVYHNLPAPTYSQFVMRPQAFADVIDGLQQRSAVVLIVGLGGNGKTSLAREVAARSLTDDGDAPRFDAVVWVSDKDRPGTTNLSVVLDEIAHTLDYPGFTQLEFDEKRREVENLLRRQRVLLVIDNLETITDGALLTWLLRLPEPAKAILTSREKQRSLWSSWLIELRGMSEPEAQALIAQRLRTLRLDQFVDDQVQFEPLVAVTGGNPKAIEIALGLIKHERCPLQQVVDDLYAARGELFDDLFLRAWALLDEAARPLLLSMTFFPDSASGEALSRTADVQGFAFDRAVERLTDLALIDVQQEDLNSSPRYTLHALVRAFAHARLSERGNFEYEARQRWIAWYKHLTSQGDIWARPTWIGQIDPEKENACAVIEWAMERERYNDVLQIAPMLGRYYSLQGLWERLQVIRHYELQAARAIHDTEREGNALRNLLEIQALWGNMDEAQVFYNQMQTLTRSVKLTKLGEELFRTASCLYQLQMNDIDAALVLAEREPAPDPNFSSHILSWSHYLHGRCRYLKGETVQAQILFIAAYEEGKLQLYTRGMMFALLELASIAIDQNQLEEAETYLAETQTLVSQDRDRRMQAPLLRTLGRLHLARGDRDSAKASLTEAIDIFERIGMRRELAETRTELADLEARELDETIG